MDIIYKIYVVNYLLLTMIYLISGKRASGKDTFCNVFQKLLKGTVITVALADIPKKEFCLMKNLDFIKFMTDRNYKETYREEFIKFAENKKKTDKFIWCRLAMKNLEKYDHIIVSDFRYPIEFLFFQKFFKNGFLTLRIYVDDNIRKIRGWTYDKFIDEHLSETGLDDLDFDYQICNNSDGNKNILKQITDLEILQYY